MYIRKTTKKVGDKTYTNYLLVKSVLTPKGPRQKTVFSLGNLKPRPKSEWIRLADQLKDALAGQRRIDGFDSEVQQIISVQQKKSSKSRKPPKTVEQVEKELVSVCPDKIEIERCRQAGPVHVGHEFWKRLGMDRILGESGFSNKTQLLTEVMTMNRLVAPSSEHAMPDWVKRTALGDILQTDLDGLNDEALYRNMNKLYPARAKIEKALVERERSLFNLTDTIYLYDLTSTYFEGQAAANPQAKRGYSLDSRPDCKQVVVGLVIDREGFPKAHEVFDGNRADQTTVGDMLDVLQSRVGRLSEGTVVIDRGMSGANNVRKIKERGMHYIVAGRHTERSDWLEELGSDLPADLSADVSTKDVVAAETPANVEASARAGVWEEVIRQPSPTNPFQKKTRVYVKRRADEDEIVVLCKSEGRREKDRAIREKHEKRLVEELQKLSKRIESGRLENHGKIEQAIGRLRERCPRVARYYEIGYDAQAGRLRWKENAEKKTMAVKLDGSYILKTDRKELSADEIWRTYSLLTRAEKAFRDMKSPLAERPIFHQLKNRAQTHIFLCVLAYHLLVAIEKTLLSKGIHRSWGSVRDALDTHQVVTVALPTSSGDILKVRRGCKAEEEHLQLYRALEISSEIIKPKKTWVRS